MKKIRKDRVGLVVALVVIVVVIFSINNSRNLGEIDIKELGSLEENERVELKSGQYDQGKELVGIEGYHNIDSITLEENIGKKVILIDFWTYSCINCQRTLPYLTSWYEKYEDDGLLIIGVHSPEFEFEKDYDNVQNAVEKYGIEYPVVQDNEMQTWRAYQNRYWPRKYLIDIDGFIVYDHIGEGGYEETEMKIQELLEERANVLDENIDTESITEESFGDRQVGTPELYFGYGFYRGGLGNSEEIIPDKVVSYSLPADIKENTFNIEGEWLNKYDYMDLDSETGKIVLRFYSKEVNIVAGGNSEVNVILDGEDIGNVDVSEHDLYNVVNLEEAGEHILELDAKGDFEIYTFTFG